MCKLLKPSVEKSWLKYFSEEAREASVPQNTIYRHLRENNENGRGDTALNYFGRKISYGMLLDEVDKAAGAFAAAGIKKGDIVAAATVTSTMKSSRMRCLSPALRRSWSFPPTPRCPSRSGS